MPNNDHLSYRKLCEDQDLCPLGKGTELVTKITEYYTPWLSDKPDANDSDELLEALLMDMGATFPGAIGAFRAETRVTGGILELLHSPARHSARAINRGKVFVYRGDLMVKTLIYLSSTRVFWK